MFRRPDAATVCYGLALALVAVAILLTLLSAHYAWLGSACGMTLFLCAVALYAASGMFDPDEGRRKLPKPWKAMDWLLLTLRLAAIPAALVVFAYGAGGAKVIDGQYVLTSHGEIITAITRHEYQLRVLCQRMMFPCVSLPLCIDAAIQCRAALLLQQP